LLIFWVKLDQFHPNQINLNFFTFHIIPLIILSTLFLLSTLSNLSALSTPFAPSTSSAPSTPSTPTLNLE